MEKTIEIPKNCKATITEEENRIVIEFEPERWRAEEGDVYSSLGFSDFTVFKTKEDGMYLDERRYDAGNYFKTEEQAEKARELIIETLKKFHEENK